MKEENNESNDLANLSVNDFQSQETKIVLLLLKNLVDNQPNDTELGKELRFVFSSILK